MKSVKSVKSVIRHLLLRVRVRFLIFMNKPNHLGKYQQDRKSLTSLITLTGGFFA